MYKEILAKVNRKSFTDESIPGDDLYTSMESAHDADPSSDESSKDYQEEIPLSHCHLWEQSAINSDCTSMVVIEFP